MAADAEQVARPCKWCGAAFNEHDYQQLARYCYPIQIEALEAIQEAAAALVKECNGGLVSPSLGALARLESALAVAHKGNFPDDH